MSFTIRRKPGKAIFWGPDGVLDLADPKNTSNGHLTTLELGADSVTVQAHNGAPKQVGPGHPLRFDSVILTLEKIERGEAYWVVRTSRNVRVLRDDAKRG